MISLLLLLTSLLVVAAPLTQAQTPTPTPHRADWMSGKHGIGYRVPGGVGLATALYDVEAFANQISTLLPEISYVIIGLSSGAYGDRYLSPHPVLSSVNRGSTPVKIPGLSGINDWYSGGYNSNFTIEDYEDRDLFDEILTAMANLNVKVIAYMASQGPSLLKHGETKAYDYYDNSPYVDSCSLCPSLTGIPGNCACAPSVHNWKNYVKATYGFDDDATLRLAYANDIVGYYANKFGDRIAGYWFDQGNDADGPLIRDAIRQYSTNAVIAFSKGTKVPLRNNNPGIEDYTFGHMTPLKAGRNPSDGCYNYGMILAAESSINGYVYNTMTNDDGSATNYNYQTISDPALRPNGYIYDTSSGNGQASLAHVFMPAGLAWNNGDIQWNIEQAREWQSRVLNSGGAWTWNVARDGCAYCLLNGDSQSLIDVDDYEFLKRVYRGLPGSQFEVKEPWEFNDLNCDCYSSNSQYPWGCPNIPPTRTLSPTPAPTSSPTKVCTRLDDIGGELLLGDGSGNNGISNSEFKSLWGTGPISIKTTVEDGNYFSQINRNVYYNGIWIELDPMCAISGVEYTFDIKYRLHGVGPNGEGDTAIAMLSWLRDSDVPNDWGHEHFVFCNNPITNETGWLECQSKIILNDDKVQSTRMSVKFSFRSPWNLFHVDYDDISFKRTPDITCSNSTDIVITDGTAEAQSLLGIWSLWGKGPIMIGTENVGLINENSYFAQTLRTSKSNGIGFKLNPTCVVSGVEYTFDITYRLHGSGPNGESDTTIGMLSWKDVDGNWDHQHFAFCNTPVNNSTGWVNCTSTILMNEDKASSIDMEIKFNFKAQWNLFNADYDNVKFYPTPLQTPNIT